MSFDELKREPNPYQKLHMLSVKAIDIVLRVKTSVHDKLGLSKAQDIQILKEMFNSLGIRDISGEFTVVKGQAGFFAKNKEQIDLRQPVILFVLAPLNLI